jgi:hypothetical protein
MCEIIFASPQDLNWGTYRVRQLDRLTRVIGRDATTWPA